MSRRNRNILIVCIAVVTILLLYIGGAAAGLFKMPKFIEGLMDNDEPTDSIEKALKVIQENFNTEILILGSSIEFETAPEFRYVEGIDEETVKKGSQYKVIILNDLEGKITLSNDNINALSEYISEEGNILIYLGERYKTVFDDTSKGVANVEGNLFYMYYMLDDNPHRNIGAWTQTEQEYSKDYPYLLGNALIYAIESYIEESN